METPFVSRLAVSTKMAAGDARGAAGEDVTVSAPRTARALQVTTSGCICTHVTPSHTCSAVKTVLYVAD